MYDNKLRLAAACSLVALLGCGPETSAPLSTAQSGITFGSPYPTGRPAIGGLLVERTGLSAPALGCTATLIGPTTVLTAAHCIANAIAGTPLSEWTFSFAPEGGGSYPAVLVKTHPRFNTFSGPDLVYDAAILTLASAPPITPIPVSWLPAVVGQAVTLVGYCGQTRSIGQSVVEQTSYILVLPPEGPGRSGVCPGDSGGPLLATLGGQEVVIGVASSYDIDHRAYYVRADYVLPWLKQRNPGDLAPNVSQFSDVAVADPYFPFIDALQKRGITSGCGGGQYCPDGALTRGQAAIFLVRARNIAGASHEQHLVNQTWVAASPDPQLGFFGGSADNFSFAATPYFSDVPASHPYFKWIQKLYEQGATAGCAVDPATGARRYCPDDVVTHGMMSILTTRMHLGLTFYSSNRVHYPTDVPSNDPWLPFVSRTIDERIFCGIGDGTFGRNVPVSRRDAATYVERAFFGGERRCAFGFPYPWVPFDAYWLE